MDHLSVMVEHLLGFPVLWPSGSDNTQFMNGKCPVSGHLVAVVSGLLRDPVASQELLPTEGEESFVGGLASLIDLTILHF